MLTLEDLAAALESTLLHAAADGARVSALCAEAAQLGFGAVCVAPSRAAEALDQLRGSPVRVVAVAGFPLGHQTTGAKVAEIQELVELGAHEVDVVMNIGVFLDGRISALSGELRELRRAARGRVLKVILETGYLSPDQLRQAAALVVGAGADYLKTSTGYGPAGARLTDVRLLRQIAGRRCRVKAAGGIRTFEQAQALLAAGADRLGTSAAAALWEEARRALDT